MLASYAYGSALRISCAASYAVSRISPDNFTACFAARELSGEAAQSTDLPDLHTLTQILVPQPFEPNRSPIFHYGYAVLESVHEWTGLPWWATIPLTTLMVRTCLLPLSLRQARIIRSSYTLYRETSQLLERERDARKDSPASTSPLHRARAAWHFLETFTTMRKALGAPHPIWIIINPMIQVPIFIYTTASIRNMALLHWPGFAAGGALWFPNLTLPALLLDTSLPLLEASTLPMGPPGFLLPSAIAALTLTSIRLGFRAAGGGATSPLGATLYRVLPPLLYTLTAANTYMTVQLPQAPLLHWTTSCLFTLSLQLAMQHPTARQLLGLPGPPSSTPKALPASTPAAPAGPSTAQPAHPQHADNRPSTSYAAQAALLPPSPTAADPLVAAQAAASSNPDLLVIMAAQHSARQHYANSLACLQRALQLNPKHPRANYSLGQVYSLTRQWGLAEQAFRRCAEAARQPATRGQALYCVGSALQAQGKPEDAVAAYKAAAEVWEGQAVVWFSLANAYSSIGQVNKALEAVEKALQLDGSSLAGSGTGAPERSQGGGLTPALLELRQRLQAAAAAA